MLVVNVSKGRLVMFIEKFIPMSYAEQRSRVPALEATESASPPAGSRRAWGRDSRGRIAVDLGYCCCLEIWGEGH